MITFKVTKSKLPYKLRNLGKDILPFINDYIFRRINSDLEHAVGLIAKTYIYQKLKRTTGKIGESMTPDKQRVNQYSSLYGFYFDTRKAYWSKLHISEDASKTVVTIKPKKGTALAVPARGGPADIKTGRKQPSDYGGRFERRKGTNVLTRGDTAYFTLHRAIAVRPSISYWELSNELEYRLQPSINRLALQAVERFAKQ
jgi:hypothetical protein